MNIASADSQLDLMAMAKQGDLNALASLMNRTLKPRGIFAELELTGDRLTVTSMFSMAPPAKAGLVGLLRKGLETVRPEGVKRVIVRAIAVEDEALAWQGAFMLRPPSKRVSPLRAVTDPWPAGNGPKSSSLDLTEEQSVSAAAPGRDSHHSVMELAHAPGNGTAGASLGSVHQQPLNQQPSLVMRWRTGLGYGMLLVGTVTLLTGLGQNTVAKTDATAQGLYEFGAIATKTAHSQAGGALMITGAILVVGSDQRSRSH